MKQIEIAGLYAFKTRPTGQRYEEFHYRLPIHCGGFAERGVENFVNYAGSIFLYRIIESIIRDRRAVNRDWFVVCVPSVVVELPLASYVDAPK